MRKIPDVVASHLSTGSLIATSLAAKKQHAHMQAADHEEDLNFLVVALSIVIGLLICVVAFLLYFTFWRTSEKRTLKQMDEPIDTVRSHPTPEKLTEDTVVAPRKKISCKKIAGLDGITRSLGWLTLDLEEKFAEPLQRQEAIDLVPAPWTISSITKMLSQHRLPMDNWGEDAKLFLAEELCSGKARLLYQAGPMRAVELVLVVLKTPEGLVLQQTTGKGQSYGFTLSEKVPNTRRLVNETTLAAAKRCLKEKIKLPEDLVQVHDVLLGVADTVENTDFLPGLKIVVRKFLVSAELRLPQNASEEAMKKTGLLHGELQVGAYAYKWVAQGNATGLVHHFHRRRASVRTQNSQGKGETPMQGRRSSRPRLGSTSRTILDGIVKPLLPWTEEHVAQTCSQHGIRDAELELGSSLPALVSQLNDGSVSLGVRASDGKLICLQDYVSLLVTTPCKTSFVAEIAGGSPAELAAGQLPQAIKLSAEDIWCAAFRVSYSRLGLLSNELVVEEESVQEVMCRPRCEELKEPRNPKHVRNFLVRARVLEGVELMQDLSMPSSDSDRSA